MIVGIDPGRDQGWAVVSRAGTLLRCGLGEPVIGQTFHGDVAFVELPQVYRAAMSKGDPNDLIKVAYGAGKTAATLMARGFIVRTIAPRDWKGTVNPDVMCRRIVSKLTPQEILEFQSGCVGVSASKHHNIIDAIGIAKWGASQ